MSKRKFNVVDLFCGCGGFSQGFSQAGYRILYGIDSWKDATITYHRNFPNAKIVNSDICCVRGDDIVSTIGIDANDIDVIIGGPPCQGFSVSGKRLLDDPRNSLYKSFVTIVEDIQPKVFVMENVPGLVRLFHGEVKDAVINDFSKLGYEVREQILSADSFGVPQQRKRVFFVGLNKQKIVNTSSFSFPSPTHGDYPLRPLITCKDALSDLDFIPDDISLGECIDYELEPQNDYQRLMRRDCNKIFNHSITIHNGKTKSIISLVPDGGNYKDLPKELQATRKVHIAWTRMNSTKPCFTIDTGHNHHFHYKENRVPTVRESARIQSFPDCFEFIGIKTSQLKQVGNAVPPLLAEALANEIKKTLLKG